MKVIIVWFRNDLRLHDHPAMATALADAEVVIPVFILNDDILHGRNQSANRNRFLLQSLEDLKTSLESRGSNLVIRSGQASEQLTQLAAETGAEAVYYSADYTPYAIKRDKTVKADLGQNRLSFRGFPGRLAVSNLDGLLTKAGTTFKVFTPFYNNWQLIGRREVAPLPSSLPGLPTGLSIGELPPIASLVGKDALSPEALPGGESAGRKRLTAFLATDIDHYRETNNIMATDGTSRLSSYLHFGCLSPREIETLLPASAGATAWHRQLAWREFYHYILFKFPANANQEFQERYHSLEWDDNPAFLQAWQDGQTGYPIVDASMRQLLQQGWMHNRARLIVGSFLTKDLWLDWRLGEQHFMRLLIDGDQSNNNGNWQWIASVGVDPAPVFRRLYNPTSQQNNFDPDGVYVRRFVAELKNVPAEYLAEPWTMPEALQLQIGCVIGVDYPAPIVDHKTARLKALDHYREAATKI